MILALIGTGQSFLFALGRSQFLYVADTYFVREINCFTSLDMGKPAYLQKDRGALLGKGLITTNGAVWYHQRKTIAPHLFMDKVKVHFKMVKNCETFRHMFIPLVFDKKSFLDEIP